MGLSEAHTRKTTFLYFGWVSRNPSMMYACVCAVDCAADVSGSTDVAESSCVCCTLISEQAGIT